MTSKPVAFLLADLGVVQSHSRPHVSNDNPFSEAQFKTLKYRPDFPARFATIEAARAHCETFFPWYNDEHRHSGLGPSHGHRCAPRPRRRGPRRTSRHPDRCLRGPPRTVRPETTRTTKTTGHSLDQPANRDAGGNTVNLAPKCLHHVDRFRP